MKAALAGIVIGLLLGAVPAALYYQGQIEDASARIAELENAKAALEQENRDLARENEDLRSQLEQARSTIQELQEQVESLQDEVENLTLELEERDARIQELEAEKSQLQAEIEDLRESVAQLQSQVHALQSTLEALNDTLHEVLEWYGYSPEGVYNDVLLEAAPETVRDEAAYLLRGLGETGARALEVWRYILINTMYAYDSYVRVYDGDSIVVVDHHVMLPNETLLLGQGDCDDLALLAYALLTAEPLDGERVYLVAWYPSEGPGHTAVVIATPQGYYILDPAGNYLNGWGLYLEMKIEDYTSERNAWYYYFDPLNIRNTTKHYLLDNYFAVLDYYNYFTDQDYYRLDSVDPVEDAFTALYQWIVEYWGVDPETIEFHAPGVHVEFTSIADAADWLESSA